MVSVLFLDKDGTLVDNSGHPEVIPSDVILDNVVEGLVYAQKKGFILVIVSNQPWISKGLLSKEDVERNFESLVRKLFLRGVKIDSYHYCPHQSSDNCECKKPKTKMILDAIKGLDVDLDNSYVIGDMDSDILMGKALGIKTILVKTGKGKDFLDIGADYIIDNLNSLREII